MSDLQVIAFDAGVKLDRWPSAPADRLLKGEPVAHGHYYLNDEANGLTAGVWHCTPMTTKPGPYKVNEFMHLLKGSVTFDYADGTSETFKAGDSFIVHKGTPVSWNQSEDVLKYFVIFNDASGAAAAEPEKLRAIRLEPHGPAATGMAQAAIADTSLYEGGVPTQHSHNYFSEPTGQLVAGVWDTTPMFRKTMPFPRHELMMILEGAVTITDGNGKAQTFKAGESFFAPKGAVFSWTSTEYVRKYYVIFQPKAAAAVADAAE